MKNKKKITTYDLLMREFVWFFFLYSYHSFKLRKVNLCAKLASESVG